MTEFHKRSNRSTSNHSKRVAKSFAKRRTPEEQKRLKQQRKARDAERSKSGRRRGDWLDDDGEIATFEKIRHPHDDAAGRAGGSPDARRVQAASEPEHPADPARAGEPTRMDGSDAPLASTHATTQDDARTPGSPARPRTATESGRVIGLARARAQVACDGDTLDLRLDAALAAVQQTALAVGDLVRFTGTGPGARVVEVLPRRTVLARPDPGNPHRQRVLAANVDVAVLVLSVRRPAFRPGLADRFLVALADGGVQPVIVANKADLLSADEERDAIRDALSPFVALGVPALLASADTGEGLAELSALLAGRTSVFVGHSGVGKSSLLNGLDPEGRRRVSSGREGDGKGRHTTTGSSLTELTDGTSVIDTPGVRAFGLWHLDRRALAAAFPELVEHGARCRFGDCSHLVEPDCAVIAAVAAGDLPQSRYAAYARIHASLGDA